MTINRGPVRTLAGDREATWPEAITGARCPHCGRFVGSAAVLPFVRLRGRKVVDVVSGICATHGRVVATGWRAWP